MSKERAKGEFRTIDPAFFFNKARLEPQGSDDAAHRSNGKPTQFTDLTREDLTLDPHRAAMLRRSNFLPYDGVLYEIDDAPDEEDALWSHNGRHHLTYFEYLRIIREEQRMMLQSIVVKHHEAKSVDYSKSPHRPLMDFFKALVDPHSPKRLRLLIPPTLVQAESSRTVYFTDPATGFVRRLRGDEIEEGFLRKAFLDGARKSAPSASNPEVPMAVTKRMSGGKNDISLLDINGVLMAFRGQLEGALVMQKFTKPRGAHAALYRTTWRRKGPPTTVLVSCMKNMKIPPSHPQASSHFCANSTDLDSNNVLSFRGKAATETQSICAEIVDYVENRSGERCKFDVFVGDFLKDEHERWYFLQAKSFVCSRVT